MRMTAWDVFYNIASTLLHNFIKRVIISEIEEDGFDTEFNLFSINAGGVLSFCVLQCCTTLKQFVVGRIYPRQNKLIEVWKIFNL